MKNYVANPNYSDATGSPYWSVVGGSSPDAAVADVTQLVTGLVSEDGVNYRAAHVEDLSKLLVGTTASLAVDAVGVRNSFKAASSSGIARGENYVYVDDVTNFTSGITAAILEGTLPTASPYSQDSMTTDGFTSEGLKVRSRGLIPLVSQTPAGGLIAPATTIALYLPTNVNYYDGTYSSRGATPPWVVTGSTYSTLIPISTIAGTTGTTELVPANLTSATPPAFYLAASADPQAQANLIANFYPDFTTYGMAVSSVLVGSTRTVINCTTSATAHGFTTGQSVTFVGQGDNAAGWNAGLITSFDTFTMASCTLSGTTISNISGMTGLAIGQTVTGTGIPNGTTITAIASASSITVSASMTAGTNITVTVTRASAGSHFIVTDFTSASTATFGLPGTWGANINLTGTVSSTAAPAKLTVTAFTTPSFGTNGSKIAQGVDISGWTGTVGAIWADTVTAGPGVGSVIQLASGTTSTTGTKTVTMAHSASSSFKVPFRGNVTSGNNVITNLDFWSGDTFGSLGNLGTAGLGIGQTITGSGIPASTTITAISPTQITISANATVTSANVSLSATCFGMIYASTPISSFSVNSGENSYSVSAVSSPYYATWQSGSGPIPVFASGGGGSLYGKDLFFPVKFTSFTNAPIANFQSITGTTSAAVVSVDSVANLHVGQNLTFRGEYNGTTNNNWVVQSIDLVNNTFTCPSSSTAYTFSPTLYSNGDSPNGIWSYDDTIYSGGTIDILAGTTSGSGAIGFSGSTLLYNHMAGMPVGAYIDGTRYIGSSEVGDLEGIMPSSIGSKVGGTLNQAAMAGATSFIVGPNPTTNSNIGGWDTVDQYGNSTSGGYVPLITNGSTFSFSGTVATNSKVITAVTNASHLAIGQTVTVDGGGTGNQFVGAEIVSISGTSVTVSTAYQGTGATGTKYSKTLISTIGSLRTVVIGQGTNQEMVSVIPPSNVVGNTYTQTSYGQTADGSGNANAPMIWQIANGQSLQYDHDAGDTVVTPNFVYSGGGSTIAHAQNAPVLGSPDLAQAYDSTTLVTNYSAAPSLVASNNSSLLSVEADVELALDDPWRDSGVQGSPNISTTLVNSLQSGDTTLSVTSNDGFPTSYTTVMPSGINILPPEVGRLTTSLSSGASTASVAFSTDWVPDSLPCFVTIGQETLAITSIGVSGSTATLSFNAPAASTHPAMSPIHLYSFPTDVQYTKVDAPTFYLSSGLTALTPYFTLLTTPIPDDLPYGTQLFINSGSHRDSFWCAGPTDAPGGLAPAGTTSLAIGSAIGITTFASGDTSITLSQAYGTFKVGEALQGGNLGSGTTITAVSDDGLTLTLSTPTTGVATGYCMLQPYTPRFAYPAATYANGVFSAYNTTVTVGLGTELEPEQDIIFEAGNTTLAVVAASYTPSYAASVQTKHFVPNYNFDGNSTALSGLTAATVAETYTVTVSDPTGLAIGMQVFISSFDPYTPTFILSISGSVLTLTYPALTTDAAATLSTNATQLIAPPSLVIGDANDTNQETVYPISIPYADGSYWSFDIADGVANNHNGGAPVTYYQWPTNLQKGDVTYRPDEKKFIMWDGAKWRTARVSMVQTVMSMLGASGGGDTVDISIAVPTDSGDLETPPDVFVNAISTGYSVYRGGSRAVDPSKNEWTGDTLQNALIRIRATVPHGKSIAFRSLGLNVQYKSAPVARQIHLSPANNLIIGDGLTSNVNWLFSDMDGDKQSAWLVKIFDSYTIASDGFDPDTSTAMFSATGKDKSQTVSLGTENGFHDGHQYYVYVKVAKQFQNQDWWGDWNNTHFTAVIYHPTQPLIAVYTDNTNAVNTISIQSSDNLLGPDNGSFAGSRGGWQLTTTNTGIGVIDALASGTTLRTAITKGATKTSIDVGAYGYIKIGSSISGTGGGKFVVVKTSGGKDDPIGFPVSGTFWVTVSNGGNSEAMLVQSLGDGNNTGDTFVIKQRQYNYRTKTGGNGSGYTFPAGSTVIFGIQKDIFVGSTLHLEFSETIKDTWTTTSSVLVRSTPGKPPSTRTVNIADYQITGHAWGEKNSVNVTDESGSLRHGFGGQAQIIWARGNPYPPEEVKIVGGVAIMDRSGSNWTKTYIITKSTRKVQLGGPMTTLPVQPNYSAPFYETLSNGCYSVAYLKAGTALEVKGIHNYDKLLYLAQDYHFGDSVMHFAYSADEYWVKAGATVIYRPPTHLSGTKVTFSHAIGQQPPYGGLQPKAGDLLRLFTTQTYGGAASSGTYKTSTTKHLGGPGHEHITSAKQNLVVDFSATPITGSSATFGNYSGTISGGVLSGGTFTALTGSEAPTYISSASWSAGSATVTCSTASLALGQVVSGYGIDSATTISAIGTGTITLSKVAVIAGASAPIVVYPTFNAIHYSSNIFGAANPFGYNLSGLGISNGSTVLGATSDKLTMKFSGIGTIGYSATDINGHLTTPITSSDIKFTPKSTMFIPGGSTTLPVKNFTSSGNFPVGTTITAQYEPRWGTALYQNNCLLVSAFAGTGTSSDIIEISLLHRPTINQTNPTWTPANSIPVVPNVTYAFTAFTKVVFGGVPTALASIAWFTSSGTYISTSAGDSTLVNEVDATFGSGWVPVVVTAAAPSTAAYGVPILRWTNVTNGDLYGNSGFMFKALEPAVSTLVGTHSGSTSKSTSLPLLSTVLTPTNSAQGAAINIPTVTAPSGSELRSLTPLGGFNSLYVFDPLNAHGKREIHHGGSDTRIHAVLIANAYAGDTQIRINSTLGIAVGTTLQIRYGGAYAENVTVSSAWDGTNLLTLTSPLVYNQNKGRAVFGVTAGMSDGVRYVQSAGTPVAIVNWSPDGYVNQNTGSYHYNVEKSIDGGNTWNTIRNGGNLNANGRGYYSITDYEVSPGQANVWYRATPTYIKNGGKSVTKAMASAPIPAATIVNDSWWIASTSNEALRFPILVKNNPTETQKHPAGTFYPLGSSRPITVSGVVQGLDGEITVIWTDLANYDNFKALINMGEVLTLTNPVESVQRYIFINSDVQITHNAASSPWREIVIQYVEAAPPGYGFTYGS